MPIFGWDASHYDGNLTAAVLKRAAAEGIAFFSHKLGEGIANTDPTAATALAAARDAGIQVLGAYWFVHGNDDPRAEAAQCMAVADRDEPWWRTFPGWFWQTDAETSPTGLPSPAYVKAFSDELARLSGRTVIVYASHGMYGDRLAGLGHPLWNAHYPSARQAGFASLYPGDTSSGWAPYSGQTPVICQYSSSATIAGRATCDANAFRGTVADLLTLIGADMPATAADAKVILTSDNTGIVNPSFRPDSPTHVPAPAVPNPQIALATSLEVIMGEAHAANVNAASALTAVSALQAKVAALPTTALPAAPIDVNALAAALIPAIAAALKADMAAVIAAELAALQK